MTTPENATLASKIFQMLSEGRLQKARTEIEMEIARREPPPPYDEIVAAYNLCCHMMPPVRGKLAEVRKAQIRNRYRQDPEVHIPGFWMAYFTRAAKAPWLNGTGGKGFLANFDWLIGPKNMAKVLGGNYDVHQKRATLDRDDLAVARYSGASGA